MKGKMPETNWWTKRDDESYPRMGSTHLTDLSNVSSNFGNAVPFEGNRNGTIAA